MKRSEAYHILQDMYDEATEEQKAAISVAMDDIEFVDLMPDDMVAAVRCPMCKYCLDMGISALKDQSNTVQRVANTDNALGGWISVKDDLPVAYITVLTARRRFDRIVPSVCMDYIAITGLGKKVWAKDTTDWKSTVTHWMPLPEPPEVEV